MIFEKRDSCIFCNSKEFKTLFSTPYTIPIRNSFETSFDTDYLYMPYNVQICSRCKTAQTEYVADIKLLYENNFAGFHGSIRNTHNTLFSEFILKNNDVTSICEIGAGNGMLSDTLMEAKSLTYTIVDPSFGGNTTNKKILSTYFEECNEEDIQCDTLVMSQVFEHFYKPVEIIKKIKSCKNIQHIYLSFPDLESYIRDGTYHVLNPEHTFYVDNAFVEKIFGLYGFTMKRIHFHENHSVFFEFIRGVPMLDDFPVNKESEEKVRLFFNRLLKAIDIVNSLETILPIYIWPCSMHTIFAFSLGLDSSKVTSILDNSPAKLHKFLYGYRLECLPFTDRIHDSQEKYIILSGGCYNKEVIHDVTTNPSNKVYTV